MILCGAAFIWHYGPESTTLWPEIVCRMGAAFAWLARTGLNPSETRSDALDTRSLPCLDAQAAAPGAADAVEIANALLAEGCDEGKAIRIGIAKAKEWAENHEAFHGA